MSPPSYGEPEQQPHSPPPTHKPRRVLRVVRVCVYLEPADPPLAPPGPGAASDPVTASSAARCFSSPQGGLLYTTHHSQHTRAQSLFYIVMHRGVKKLKKRRWFQNTGGLYARCMYKVIYKGFLLLQVAARDETQRRVRTQRSVSVHVWWWCARDWCRRMVQKTPPPVTPPPRRSPQSWASSRGLCASAT